MFTLYFIDHNRTVVEVFDTFNDYNTAALVKDDLEQANPNVKFKIV